MNRNIPLQKRRGFNIHFNFIAPCGEFDVWIPVPTCSPSGALIIFFSCLHFCMSRQSQILFLSDVVIFIVHVWCATQTRPRFNVPSERRDTTTWVVHPYPTCTMPGPGIEPKPFGWEAEALPLSYIPLITVTNLVKTPQRDLSQTFTSRGEGWWIHGKPFTGSLLIGPLYRNTRSFFTSVTMSSPNSGRLLHQKRRAVLAEGVSGFQRQFHRVRIIDLRFVVEYKVL